MQQQWLAHELEEIWSLNSEEQRLLFGLSDVNRLGFSVCLKFFQNEGYFPANRAEVPRAIVEYLAEFLGLSPSLFDAYTLLGRSNKRHRSKIRAFLGVRVFHSNDLEAAERHLVQCASSGEHTDQKLIEILRKWFCAHKIEPPVVQQQKRIVRNANHGAERDFFDKIHSALPENAKRHIDTLLSPKEETEDPRIGFHTLKSDAALGNPDGLVKDVLFSVVNEETLEALVKEYQAKGPGYQRQVQILVRNSYRGHYRRMVPKILDVLKFRSNNAHHRPVIEALDYLKSLQGSGQRFIDMEDVPVETVVPDELRPLVIENSGEGGRRINRIYYEVCVLQAFRERLHCKEIWIEGADRYRNPDQDVPQDFADKREEYYGTLDQPLDADTFIAGVQREMREVLTHFNRTLPQNDKVSLRPKGKKRIRLSRLEPQPEPMQLRSLKGEIGKRWPMTSLLYVLKEAELRIGFTRLFKGLGNRKILGRATLQSRLLLCLYGLGSNTGLKRILSKE